MRCAHCGDLPFAREFSHAGARLQAAASYGCEVDTLTLSVEQKELAEERVRERGLEGRVRVHLMDYRDIPPEFENAFDAFVSIEMLEHVGSKVCVLVCFSSDASDSQIPPKRSTTKNTLRLSTSRSSPQRRRSSLPARRSRRAGIQTTSACRVVRVLRSSSADSPEIEPMTSCGAICGPTRACLARRS